jgi:hypothetical protein
MLLLLHLPRISWEEISGKENYRWERVSDSFFTNSFIQRVASAVARAFVTSMRLLMPKTMENCDSDFRLCAAFTKGKFASRLMRDKRNYLRSRSLVKWDMWGTAGEGERDFAFRFWEIAWKIETYKFEKFTNRSQLCVSRELVFCIFRPFLRASTRQIVKILKFSFFSH